MSALHPWLDIVCLFVEGWAAGWISQLVISDARGRRFFCGRSFRGRVLLWLFVLGELAGVGGSILSLSRARFG